MNKIIGIYKITSPSGKIYIGQSKDVLSRQNGYKYVRCKKQYKLYRSLLKYGWEAHKFEVIHYCSVDKLNELEIDYIMMYNCFNTSHGLNLKDGGQSPLTQESRDKIRKSLTGRKQSKELIEKCRLAHIGLKRSEETKIRMSIAMTGISHGALTSEHKQKISTSNKGKVRSEEARRKYSDAKRNTVVSDITREKISRKLMGNIPWNKGKNGEYNISDIGRENIRIGMKKLVSDPVHLQKMKENGRKGWQRIRQEKLTMIF